MKKLNLLLILLLPFLMTLTGCTVVEGIFKAGMGVGIFIVLAIIVVVIYLFNKMGKK